MPAPAPVRIVPLGGLGEVGMNCMVIESGGDRVVIDCGLMFPNAEQALGVEVIAPDLSYLRETGKLDAILLTHAHEDHIGALPYLMRDFPDATVCGTKFTLAVVKEKLKEHGISADLQEVTVRGMGMVGNHIDFEPLQVPHSVPDAVGYALLTEAGLVIHTGDFKVDWSPVDGKLLDVRRFAELGETGVACLMSDSTNAEREGTSVSEREVGESLMRIFSGPMGRGRVVVAMFGSNIHRVQSVVRASLATNRKLVVLGRSMQTNVNLARELGYLRAPPDSFVDPEAAGHFAPRELTVLCTGAQGEPRSALARLALGEHPHLHLDKNDLVILSSRVIPGNDRTLGNIIDHLVRRGCRVLSSANMSGGELIHTSGHACQGEQRMMIDLVRPRSFVPIHGEYRMLAAHARTAELAGVNPHGCLVIEDGDAVELRRDEIAAALPRAVSAGRLYLDARGAFADVGEITLRDRQLLAETGMLVCLCVLDHKSGEVLRGPELLGKGVAGLDEARTAQARAAALDALQALQPAQRTDHGMVEEALRRAVRSVWKKGVEKRPMVLPVVLEI
ncbi:MAG TPA: ribonuclease J [Myxococcales bacterium]|nr:ribonuclease J [Myxococcales bacterium]